MKQIISNYLILIALLSTSALYSQKCREKTFESVTLRLIHLNWDGDEWHQPGADTLIIDVLQGQRFGDNMSLYLFTLDEIIDSNSVKISIPSGFKILNTSSLISPNNNQVIITGNNNCFRISNDVEVTDYCIDIIGLVQYKYVINNHK